MTKRNPNSSVGSRRGAARALTCALLSVVLAGEIATARAQARTPGATAPIEVKAVYDVTLGGVRFGGFSFVSNVRKARYRIRANADAKVGFGAFKFFGQMTARGAIGQTGPAPVRYSHRFDSERKLMFRKKTKRNEVALAFKDGRVVKRKVVPPAKTGGRVPLRKKHLASVLDPLAAVLALSDGGRETPCRRDVEVFDGKTRFRIVLNPKNGARPRRTASATDYTCSVRYVQIAGHKKSSDETSSMAKPGAIDMVLRRHSGVNVLVPVLIRISTMMGEARVAAKSVNVVTADRRRLAFLRD